MPKNNTKNKSNRDINQQFDIKQFNKQFEMNDRKKKNDPDYYDEISDKLLPHNKTIEDIIINISEIFYKTMDLLIDGQNPLPYLISTPDRFFASSIILLSIGILLLLINLMLI